MEENPFADLKISEATFLDDIPARTECPKCGRTRKYYCYTCYVPMTGVQDKISKIKSPLAGSTLADGSQKRSHDGTTGGEEPSVKKRHVVKEASFDRVVFIDSTWNQTMKIYKDERLKGLKQVELKTRTTRFWRYQRDKPNTYLATIEAVYYFFVDYHKLFVDSADNGCYDDLLFFFSYMYRKIRTLHDAGKPLMAYKQFEEKAKKKSLP